MAKAGEDFSVEVTCSTNAITATVGGDPVPCSVKHLGGDRYRVTIEGDDVQPPGPIVIKGGGVELHREEID